MILNCVICETPLVGRQRLYCGAACQKREGRRKWVEKVYGITLEQYDRILEDQGGVCAICRRPPKAGQFLHIDHEHGGHVRGLVCAYCNTRLIGRLKNHDLAQRLADYLRNPPAERALGYRVIAPGRPKKRRGKRRKQ